MMTQTIIAGVDVSKHRLDITLYDGNIQDSYDIAYTAQAFNCLMQDYEDKQIHVVCEATGNYHLKLGKIAYDMGIKFSSVNPFIIKRYSDICMKRAKTDRVDSRLIAQYGFEYTPESTVLVSPSRMTMQQILKTIDDLHNTESEYRNRLEAHSVNPYGLGDVEAVYVQILDTVKIERKKLEDQLIGIVQTEHKEPYELLLSIPGIGPIGASVIIAFFGSFESFATSKQVISYLGTSPVVKQSGLYKGKTMISRMGNPYLRKKLYMCAISARTYNPHCIPLYQRLIEKGMAKKPATIAVLNKLVRQAFGVLKSKKPFNHDM
jgi:transposase